MIDNLAHKEEVEYPVSNELLNFLDYTVLLLSQVNTSDEVDLIMDDFSSSDLVKILSENREFFSVLSSVWLTAFKRVFILNGDQDFPMKLLRIPALINELNWDQNCVEHAKDIHRECLMMTLQNKSLTNLLLLLFLEGIIYSSQEAINNFINNIEPLIENEEDRQGVNVVIEDLVSLGW